MKKINEEWHKKNVLGRNKKLADRIKWHKEHVKYCICRGIPESIKKYL